MNKLSVVIITLNAEPHLKNCLESIMPVADEIVVLDSFSTDRTMEIAESFNVTFSQRKPDSLIDQMRNAVEMASNDWVFCIDQDERATPGLIDEITRLKSDGFTYDGYLVKRLNFYISDWFKACGWYPDAKLRLFNRTKGTWGGNEPHYKLEMKPGTKTGRFSNHILHYSYKDLSSQIQKMEQFSKLFASDRLQKGGTSLLWLKIVFDPAYRFIRAYFFEGGFRYGMRGFICAWILAFYVFSKYAKIWEGLQYQNGNCNVIHPDRLHDN
jgi:glycosyltransferase involved in cell wall biosynthesis